VLLAQRILAVAVVEQVKDHHLVFLVVQAVQV
jgi:hypothetical protein